MIATPAVLVVALAPQARADSPLTELVDAAAQRLQLAEPVAAVKWKTHGAIEDPGRVEQELAKVGAEATARHVDPDYVTRVFRDQIHATEAIEYSRFAAWKLDPANVPAGSPDLSALRSAIDALNQTMLTQIAANWG
ncbi:MAG TPA: chorismate mutase, partial [Mycobacterium sp.]|nr:chorismate mutase [Mycobacterium sp.]